MGGGRVLQKSDSVDRRIQKGRLASRTTAELLENDS